MNIGKEMLSQSKFYMGYSRWIDQSHRYETWDEQVSRVMSMHRQKYADIMTKELQDHIDYAEAAYKDKLVLGAQRALQFGGDQLFKHEARMYNCSVSHVDRPSFFNEAMYLLLCGCGVGFSVQKRHIDKLPTIARRNPKKVKIFTIPDSIEGWADAFAALISSYFTSGAVFPEYRGCQVHFDFTKIRQKGSLISGGFKAPGSSGLREALVKCENIIDKLLENNHEMKLDSITAYDFVMHMQDAVLSGGVRRSATICMFDKDDTSMLNAKTGDWFIDNPQRGRSNNSAMLKRDELTRDEWSNIMKSVRDFGEPGFIFTDNLDFAFNPCVTGDTRVTVRDHSATEDGKIGSIGMVYQIPMKMLVELYETSDYPPLIISYDTKTGKIETDYLDMAAMTRKNADVIELNLENGKSVKLTPDHKVYTENRGWVEAKDLTPSDVLISLE